MLSIVIPIYNAEMYLKECIDSVLAQSYKDFELLLVDDGSDDNSIALCRKYEMKDHRIKVIAGTHKGPYFARKLGVEYARGDYITFIDSDDFISEESYVMAKGDMENSIDIISFGIFRYFDEKYIRNTECSVSAGIYGRFEIQNKLFPVMIWDENKCRYGIDPSLCSKLYKASFLKEYYRTAKDIHFHYGEDAAVIYPLISRAESVSLHQETYYYHRQRVNGDIASYIKDDMYLDKLYELYQYLSKCMSFHDVFQRQIDLFYINSVGFAKIKYGLTLYPENTIFPFDKVGKGERIVLYGAGKTGKLYVRQLSLLEYCDVILWADKNYEQFDGKVCSPKEILKTDYDKIVIATDNLHARKQMEECLLELGIGREKIV